MAGWEANWNRDVLERIVALLFALASLADLAAGVPVHRRRQVLAILSHGEAEARAFLIGMAADTPVAVDAPEDAGDAARLAVRFRALALLLCALLAQAAVPAPRPAIRPLSGQERTVRPAGRHIAPAAPDTS